ncbi:MAG: hypothetical protein LBT03_00170 [Holosporales bacterium]|jgi:two-component system osmolarity sensor histidine kinase EnvZ|nr:hypothetical protein [Holosporales bacterium]
MLPKSIFFRFLLILITPVIASQLVVSIIFSEKYTQVALGVISRQMVGEATAITKLLDMHLDPKYVDVVAKSMKLNVEVISDTKLDKTGISKSHKAYRILRRAFVKRGYDKYYINALNDNMEVCVPSDNGNDVYKISFPRRNLYMKVIPVVLGSGILSAILLLAISLVFLKNQIRPIKKLAKAAAEFGSGIDNDTYKPEGAKEIRTAGTAFCEMKKSVKELMDSRMRILAGISHDLRTPLTKMKLQLSLMQESNEIDWLMNDVDMMIKMTESFTIHAAEQNMEIFVRRNLMSFLKEVTNDYFSGDFNVQIQGEKTIEISMKYISLKRAFGNIISNAKKYAKNLYIKFDVVDDCLTVIFEDDGPGIGENISKDLFAPFVSENTARTHEIDTGVGLGLSIARDAIIAHGGFISSQNSKDYGGALFKIEFPHSSVLFQLED